MHHIENQYGVNPLKPHSMNYNPEVGLIVNEMHCDRIQGLIDGAVHESSKAKILIGGKVNKKTRYCPPTVIVNPSKDSSLMKEEIFGPVLPIITFVDFDEVIKENIKMRDKPLAVYYFGSSTGTNYNRILNETSSGSCVANDILMQTVET